MHYWRTSDILRAGVSYFAGKNLEIEDPDLLRALAWFYGYAAHVVTDLTVHPVLAASGYSYAENPGGHRMCELHQDAYIFQKLKGIDAKDAKYIENCGIRTCLDPEHRDRILPAIRELWLYCLQEISPAPQHFENGSSGPVGAVATVDVWYDAYSKRIAQYVELGGGFVFFFRDILEQAGYCLPDSGQVEEKYIRKLKTTANEAINYDVVFDVAQANVRSTWLQLCKAIEAKKQTEFAMMNANLDTGISDTTGTQIFWT